MTRRTALLDALVALAAAVAVGFVSRHIEPSDGERALDGLAYGVVVVACATLALRRRFPAAALLVSSAAVALYSARTYAGGPIYLVPLVATYGIAAQREWRSAAPVVGVALVIQLLGGVAADVGASLLWLLVYVGWTAAALFLGDAGRSRRRYFDSLEERARRLEETREEEARRRVAEERLRIARDLHDVVSHTLSAISVQAGVGAHVVERDPAAARDALLAIKEASAEAMGEVRSILGLVRETDDAGGRSPSPGLDRLDALVTSAGRAGLPVEVVVRGERYDLPAATDIAAYRIVQESLTNVARHAAPATATVAIEYADDALVVEVVDDGTNPPTASEAGHGILGMRERAAAVGGTLDARPRPTGGFLVRARLPRTAP